MIFNDWKTKEDIIESFEMPPNEAHEFKSCELIFASYSYENYSGDAWVIYRIGDNLFEVKGSHCSCYGLEGQWIPEETEFKAISFRDRDYFCEHHGSEACDYLIGFLDNAQKSLIE